VKTVREIDRLERREPWGKRRSPDEQRPGGRFARRGGCGWRTRRRIGDELTDGEMTKNDGQITHLLKLLDL